MREGNPATTGLSWLGRSAAYTSGDGGGGGTVVLVGAAVLVGIEAGEELAACERPWSAPQADSVSPRAASAASTRIRATLTPPPLTVTTGNVTVGNMSATRPRHRVHTHDRSLRRAERRTELLEAAVRAIRRVGPTVSMDAIAAEAGVTKPIIYRHFGDRVGLASALAEQFGSQLVAELDHALTQDLPP